MATINGTPQAIVSGSAPTAFPSASTDGWRAPSSRVRTFVEYSGATACVVRKLVRNQATGAWHGDVSTSDLDPLTPARGNDVRTWDVQPGDEITFQIESISGGSATVYAEIVGE